MKLKLLASTLLLILIAASWGWGATTGSIQGEIADAETGEPLIGVTVVVLGTNLGAQTDQDGRYVILNVSVDTYTLRISSVGYRTVEVSNVSVSADLATYLDQDMTTAATELEDVIRVTAETPMVIPDKVASIQIIKAEELQALPTRGFEDVVGIQTGVVAAIQTFRGGRGGREAVNGPEIYIRGGRPSEVAYYVDGFSQQDPLTGTSTGNISNNAIKEVSVVSGGFPVEYGHVASGIVNVVTKSGGDELAATVEVVTDQVYDQNWYSADVGGPVPGINNAHFFGSVERRYHGDRRPSAVAADFLPGNPDRQPNNWLKGWAYQGKLDFEPSTSMKLALQGNGSRDEWMQYRHDNLFNSEHNRYYLDKNMGLSAKFTHTLNAKTFYNLSATYHMTERFRGDGVHREDLFGYARPGGNPNTDAESLFRSWDDPTTPTSYLNEVSHTVDTSITQIDTTVDGTDTTFDTVWLYDTLVYDSTFTYRVDTDTARDAAGELVVTDSAQHAFVTDGDEGWVYDDFLRRKSSYIGFKGDMTAEINREHTLHGGFEFNRHTLRFYQHLFPTRTWMGVVDDGFADANRYGYNIFGEESDDEDWHNDAKKPIDLAFYLQDRMEWHGLIITAGVRFDYFDYKTDRLKNPDLPMDPDSVQYKGDPSDSMLYILDQGDLEPSEKFTRVSPRLGISFPVSDRTQMRVSYGKFFQRPDLQNLYVGYDFVEHHVSGSAGYFTTWGNPNLEPPKTTAYEVGVTHQVADNASFDVNVFYRDITDLIQVSTNGLVNTFYNQDYGTVKGLEFDLRMRRTNNVAANVKYTLSYATGTGSFNNENRNVAWVNSEPPKHPAALEYDQRHSIVGNLDLRFGRGEGPKLGDYSILENFGLNILASASSGLPYTPVVINNEAVSASTAPTPIDVRNSHYRPWNITIDFKMEKSFTISGYKVTPYLWVKNLLDRDNVVNVWEGTGKANTTGWLETPAGQAFINEYSTADDSGLNGEEKYALAQNHAGFYSAPRQVFFGLRASF